MKNWLKQRRTALATVLFLTAVATAATVIFLHHLNLIIATGDLTFHLSRIQGLTTILHSPVNFETFNHHGYGVNWFYPSLTLLPAAFFEALTQRLVLSYTLYIWIVNLATIGIAAYCGTRFWRNRTSGVLFALFYLFANYRLSNFFYRADLAEGTAMAFLPLVFLGAYELFWGTGRPNSGWKLLTVGMVGILYTHLLTAFLCILLLLCLTLGALFTRRRPIRTILSEGIKAVSCTALITLPFWGPFLREMSFQKLNHPAFNQLLAQALDPTTTLKAAALNQLDQSNLGLLGLIAITLPLFTLRKWPAAAKWSYGISLVLAFLTTNLFPWQWLQNTPLVYLQFPWRLLGLQAFFASICLVECWHWFRQPAGLKIGLVALALLVLSTASFSLLQTDFTRIGSLKFTTADTSQLATMGEYYQYDYAPAATIPYQTQATQHLFYLDGNWQTHPYHVTAAHFTTKISLSAAQTVTLPVFRYATTQATVNGHPAHVTAGKGGLVGLHLHAGTNTIQIGYTYSIRFYAAILIALLGCLPLLKRPQSKNRNV
ncbi:hypothetical protein IV38_GL000213 [Lactobacillus selangorensis]|uniref:Membrane protein 6-pyruvoyl-tetrahydropterin synthase-related domain-containing protein n=1 Tax=Lactobacillus selangorensis TaxID=81857 RepID=A0A0R2GBH3_9LACO|nr:6-pyruvoyl-tetrahydropterin synthase-related protein [Lactobacillus selangorensis]KRN29330.1 hypothetical protein IV38_GL000213 [Lactobacillus selangorensis]KRN34141.1 hypothetical protein IV40_GL000456 [Lactobacillus selangorensis]